MMNTRLVAIALVTVLSVAFSTPALAGDETKVIPVELKFIGNVQNQPLFHMTFNSTDDSEFTIIVRDQVGNILYKDVVKGKNISKKFMLNTEELGDAELKFTVTSKSYEKPVVFEVNKQTRFVQDVVVNKVN
jgi:hypothetical protein